MMAWCQAFICTNDGLAYSCMCASLSHHELHHGPLFARTWFSLCRWLIARLQQLHSGSKRSTWYSVLSIYRGHISLKISRKTPHSSPMRARYGVFFVNAKSGRSCIIVTVVLCVWSGYRWQWYIESLKYRHMSQIRISVRQVFSVGFQRCRMQILYHHFLKYNLSIYQWY